VTIGKPARTVVVRAATGADEAAWRELWSGYNRFYDVALPENVTAATWARILDPASSLCALVAVAGTGDVVGLANYVLHPRTYSEHLACYLEDLFVRADVRGSGAGRALIDALLERGRAAGWSRLYWHTREDNAVARRLYDRYVARDDFVRYDIELR